MPCRRPARPTDAPLQPVGRRYPSADAAPGPFVAAQLWPPHLPLTQPIEPALGGPDTALRFTRELVPLAWRGFVAQGRAAGRAIDSGQIDLTWHRLYLEAIIPAGCGVLVELAASDENVVPADDAWWPHWCGDRGAAPPLPEGTPQAAWQRESSELPHRAGLLDCPPQPGRVGLFNVLVQRAGRRLSALRGRHLWLRLTLFGNGRSTPEIAALRLWGDRFSYVRRYLPELYRDEEVFDRDAAGPATPHDYLERFSQLFEGLLTPWEDGIADARVLCDPASTPPSALPWLAGWTGETFPARLDIERRRDWLCQRGRAAPPSRHAVRPAAGAGHRHRRARRPRPDHRHRGLPPAPHDGHAARHRPEPRRRCRCCRGWWCRAIPSSATP